MYINELDRIEKTDLGTSQRMAVHLSERRIPHNECSNFLKGDLKWHGHMQCSERTVDGPTRKPGYISLRRVVTHRPRTVSPICSYLKHHGVKWGRGEKDEIDFSLSGLGSLGLSSKT